MEILPLTKQGVNELGARTYRASIRGYEVRDGDRVLAIAAIMHDSPLQLFSVMRKELKRSPKTIVKVANLMRDMLHDYEVPVFAVADRGEPNSPRFLMRMGFDFYGLVNNERVFVWHKQFHS